METPNKTTRVVRTVLEAIRTVLLLLGGFASGVILITAGEFLRGLPGGYNEAMGLSFIGFGIFAAVLLISLGLHD